MRTEVPPTRKPRAGALLGALAFLSAGAAAAEPSSVTLVGSVQTPLSCTAGDATCTNSRLSFDASDNAWQGVFSLPAGTYTFRAAVDEGGSLTTYGKGGASDGEELSLTLNAAAQVKFYYDNTTHWVTTRLNSVIAVAPGNFQSELGCPGDWQPDCLRSWLTDVDGDGIYSFSTTALLAGSYAGKVAINESWDENYGANGAPGGSDIGFSVHADFARVLFQYDSVTHVLGIDVAGAPKGDIMRAQANWVSGGLLVWKPKVIAIPAGASFRLHYDPNGAMTLDGSGISGGESIPLTVETPGLPPQIAAKFPHLEGQPVLRIADADLVKVKDILKGQIALSLVDAEGNLLDATSAQLPGVLDELYANDEALGVTWKDGAPSLKVWAPTARNVTLHVFGSSDASASAEATLPMTLEPSTGVWSLTGDASWKGKFYLYEVEVYVPASKKVMKSLVTDPYSLSLSTNSKRSQIIDLADPALAPSGWGSLVKPALAAPEDIVLYELHVRDFSIGDATVPAEKRGTFLAFTESGSNGMKHLRRLAASGLTHVHLLPVFDIATVDEDRSQHQVPAGDLASLPPDSDQQQAAVKAVSETDGFNWGYDPYHYTVPEGSYAVNPDGTARIVEFRQMVKALSDSGLRVVMDVVYNHTNAAGLADKSVLDKVVPGYYHRLNADGNVETSTCCQNTASEHVMFEKLMVDSLVTWAKFYKVDGFRFDLMGHHMKSNMVKIRERLSALTLEKDGVDGSKIYVYGEGWDFGEVANSARGVNATQLHMAGTGIGTFSDRLRDAARGGGPFSGLQEQGFISGLWYDPNSATSGSAEDQRQRLLHHMDQIRVGLAGNLRDYTLVNKAGETVKGSQVDYNGQPAGYTLDPQEVITYVSAHDNETLFDAVQIKAPASADMDARVRMHNMGLSLVALGQGIPFFHAGDELLRSKSLDRNSFNSGDWFNKLDFSYASNNWGVGLPPAGDNQSNWPIMGPLLGNAALKASPAHILQALDHFEELLKIRKSAGLFRLRTAEDIQAKVRFFNTGPSQIPGLIAMNLHDELATDGVTDVMVLFNANDEQQVLHVAEYAGSEMQLHPLQKDSADPVVRNATFEASGDFVVPGRTTAVFVNKPVPVPDAGTPDAGPGVDAGTPDDAGTSDSGSEADAGTSPDAGTDDAGTTPGTDAGTTPGTDAGTTPGTDAGTGNGGGDSGGGCGGCAGTGGEAFSALALLLGGVMQSRRRRRA
ncbi:pullulanase-type alpha-1,6-glucosidase [Vitiosangium sp. GDMCC 1.1324]|uniref:pullulanase-type alpha-1,6-glucosidase n=1 Tax=Vitiosangium sp. (strain GDMCC 1.1324) TaxID=2138576 RepID=UPI001E52118F|nr:pullulanase-type alpha-1,6-glucosidase [Vitiosangium sp. GDMCC 1.1324]